MDRRLRWLLAVPMLVVSGYALFADADWIGGWAATVDRVTGTTVLTGPLLAATSAGIQLGAGRVRPISDTTVRGWLVPLRSSLHAWLLGTTVYVVTIAVAVGFTASVPHGGPAQWWALLAGVLVLALASLAGALCAQLLPSPVTVVAAGPALFLVGAFGPPPLPEALRFGPTGSMTGLRFDPAVYLSRFAAVTAICLCLAAAMAAGRRRPRGSGRWLGVAVAAILAVASGVAVHVTGTGIGDNRLEASGERATRCAGTTPEICVAPSHLRYLKATRRSAAAAAGVLAGAGVTLPARYEEAVAYAEVSEGSGSFYLRVDHPRLTFRESVLLLTRPADCPEWSSAAGPPYAAWDAEQLIVEWAAAAHGEAPTAFNREMDAWLPHIDDRATRDWVVDTFALLRSCQFDRIGFPWE